MVRGRGLFTRSAVVVALTLLPFLLGAQPADAPCDPSVASIDASIGYRARDDDKRCEGVYRSPVSATGLQVVLVVLGGFSFDATSEKSLEVAVPNLAALHGGLVDVRAVALPIKTYYRMDARLAPGEAMRWPLRAVVRPLGLSSDEMGVFGWIDRGDERIMVPLRVTTLNRRSREKEGDRVLIGLRSAVDMDRLLWREVSEDSAASEWRPVTDRTIRGGQRISFVLPAGPGGLVRLEFAGKRRNSDDWTSLLLNVWRPGS